MSDFLTRGTSRQNISNFKPNTVVIVGTGPIEKGWAPMRSVIKTKYPWGLKKRNLKRFLDGKNLTYALAIAVFTYRAIRDELCKRYFQGKSKLASEDRRQEMDEYVECFIEFRKSLGAAYLAASQKNQLNLTSNWHDQINPKLLGDVGFITTNWTDLTFRNEPLGPSIHIHGHAENPETMILPTETSTEDEVIHEMLSKTGFHTGAIRLARDKAAIEDLRNAHFRAIEWLESARNLVFWGTELNTYDAELCSILPITNLSSRSFLKIIIKNLVDKEEELVAKVSALTAIKNPEKRIEYKSVQT